MTRSLYLALAVFVSLFTVSSNPVAVRSPNGQSMEVEVQAYTKSSGNVRIRRLTDGQVFNTKLEAFDGPSQAAIVAAAPVEIPPLRIDVTVGRRRKQQGNSSYMKEQDVTCTVKIRNEARDIDLPPSRFTILLIGRTTLRHRDRSSDYCRILAKETFDKAIPAGRDAEYQCQTITTSFDSDRDFTNLGGWEFDGYLIVVQDEQGKILDAKSSIGPVGTVTLKDEKLIRQAIGFSVGTEVERDLSRVRGR